MATPGCRLLLLLLTVGRPLLTAAWVTQRTVVEFTETDDNGRGLFSRVDCAADRYPVYVRNVSMDDQNQAQQSDAWPVCCSACGPGEYFMRTTGQLADGCPKGECQGCPKGTWKGSWNLARQCKNCTVCARNENKVARVQCSTSRDAQCGCRNNFYCNGYRCDTCTNCPPGTHKTVRDERLHCQACVTGTYMDVDNLEPQCKTCLGCLPHEKETVGCTATADSVCQAECPPGRTWNGTICLSSMCPSGTRPLSLQEEGGICIKCNPGTFSLGNSVDCQPHMHCEANHGGDFLAGTAWHDAVCFNENRLLRCASAPYPTVWRSYELLVKNRRMIVGVQKCTPLGCHYQHFQSTYPLVPLGEGVFYMSKTMPDRSQYQCDTRFADHRGRTLHFQRAYAHEDKRWDYLRVPLLGVLTRMLTRVEALTLCHLVDRQPHQDPFTVLQEWAMLLDQQQLSDLAEKLEQVGAWEAADTWRQLKERRDRAPLTTALVRAGCAKWTAVATPAGGPPMYKCERCQPGNRVSSVVSPGPDPHQMCTLCPTGTFLGTRGTCLPCSTCGDLGQALDRQCRPDVDAYCYCTTKGHSCSDRSCGSCNFDIY